MIQPHWRRIGRLVAEHTVDGPPGDYIRSDSLNHDRLNSWRAIGKHTASFEQPALAVVVPNGLRMCPVVFKTPRTKVAGFWIKGDANGMGGRFFASRSLRERADDHWLFCIFRE